MPHASDVKSEVAQTCPNAEHTVVTTPEKGQMTDPSEKTPTQEVTIFDGKKLPDFSNCKIPYVWCVRDGALQLCRK